MSVGFEVSRMYDRILLPTDGSDCAERAIDHAVELAKQFDAELHAVFVVEAGYLPPDVDDDAVNDALEDVGSGALRTVADRAEAAGVEVVERFVTEGPTSRSLLVYVDAYDVDMVVMGTHGRTGFDRLVIGSVTEKIIRQSPVPVFTVRAPQND